MIQILIFSFDIMGFSGFNTWTIISRVWALVAAVFIIVLPLFQEVSSQNKRIVHFFLVLVKGSVREKLKGA